MSPSSINCDTPQTLMGWLNLLLKKMPTWRGITAFFYVAAHWETISPLFEEYRRQIKDREDWMKAQEQRLKEIHELEKQKIIKNAHVVVRELAGLYGSAVTQLTLNYHLSPWTWKRDRDEIDPKLRQELETIMANLPPPPPQRSLADLLKPPDDDDDGPPRLKSISQKK